MPWGSCALAPTRTEPHTMSEKKRTIPTPDGRLLRITEGGARSGPVVFVLHGTPMCGSLYPAHVADAAKRGIRLVGYDRPGYGGSSANPGRTIADAAADVRTIADHLGAERFGVWGISGGGPHALACAARLVDRAVAVAALASPAPYPAQGIDWMAGAGEANVTEFHAAMEGPEALERFLAPMREAYFAPNVDPVLRDLESLLSPVDKSVFATIGSYLIDATRQGLRPGVAGWRDDDLAFVRPWGFSLEEIRSPLTLWQGKQDLFVPFAHGQWLGDHISHAVQNLTEEDGHLTLYQNRIPSVHSWLMSYLHR